MQLSVHNPGLKRALSKLQLALEKDEKGDYMIALGMYENALESMLDVHRSNSSGKIKDLLGKEMEKHMRRAEEIKSFLKVTFF